MSDHTFLELADLLQPEDLLVVNETKVRRARIHGVRRETGGGVELLFLEPLADGTWEALARPARRLRPGVIIDFDGFEVNVERGPEDGRVIVGFDVADPERVLAERGTIPLPPYFSGTLHDPGRYQTMFATTPGSVAAPTAGLHFTDEVMAALAHRGIGVARVDLHVSLDTFRPMSVADIEDHVMHSEWCSLPESAAAAIGETRRRGGRVVAVGTTVVRTLESRADGRGGVRPGAGKTDLFLRPGDRFEVVDVLVTNFHLPGSTLLVLLAAFMGACWRVAYETALERGYRFLSFGDAMLAVRRGS